jgi:hypothetical protein
MNKSKAAIVVFACLSVFAASGNAQSRKPDFAAVDEASGRLAVSYLSDADLLSEESSPQYHAARQLVRARQCATRTPNPLIYISTPLASDVVRTAPVGREPELPMRVSTVANFPNEYLRDITTLTTRPGVPPEVAEELRRNIKPNYEKLSARVRYLIADYDPRTCPTAQPGRRRSADIIDQQTNP